MFSLAPCSLRILLICGRFPWPPRRGDQLRSLQCAEALATRHRVRLLVPEPPSSQLTPPDLDFEVSFYPPRRTLFPIALALALARGLPLQSAFFAFQDLEDRIRQLAPQADLVILQLARLAAFLPAASGLPAVRDRPVVVDLIDSLSLGLIGRACRDRAWLAPLFRFESRRLARCEERLVRLSRASLLVADRDREHMASRLSTDLAARLRTVPIAMPLGEPEVQAAPEEALIFSGNLGYFVNEDALRWFVKEVWSPLLAARPGLRLICAGSRPSATLRRLLSRAGASLVVEPPDLTRVLASATVALAPLNCGSGVPLKVLEAWATCVPVVASSWAAAGVGGENGRDLLIADSVESWIAAICDLLDRPELRRKLVAAGRERLRQDYSAELVRSRFLDSVEAV